MDWLDSPSVPSFCLSVVVSCLLAFLCRPIHDTPSMGTKELWYSEKAAMPDGNGMTGTVPSDFLHLFCLLAKRCLMYSVCAWGTCPCLYAEGLGVIVFS